MPVKFVDDGLPESADFDESFAPVGGVYVEHESSCPVHREWRDLRPQGSILGCVHPKDVRFFQWMENPSSSGSDQSKPGFLQRLAALVR